uniref:Calpain catalytic domain-containing protein n=1 Tax=Fundulus heteroclitus TaxID=8078 RepID=A0A3Q2Q0J0_FUNHE
MFTTVKAFEGQQYSTLKRQCLQSGLLFEDPRFPATDDSLFYQGNRIGRVVWKRPRVSWLSGALYEFYLPF